jgi:hypothetical protein
VLHPDIPAYSLDRRIGLFSRGVDQYRKKNSKELIMRLREKLLRSTCIAAAVAVSAIPAAAAVKMAVHECVAGKPTAASYTWDFKGEANTIFRDIQAEARDASHHADQLQSIERNPELSWQIQSNQLEDLRGDINDIETSLCRLETIRRVVAPWQQREIDRIAVNSRLLADNAQDAILFLNANEDNLWPLAYRRYLNNLCDEAQSLKRSVGNAVEYSSVSKQYRDLGSKLGARTGS